MSHKHLWFSDGWVDGETVNIGRRMLPTSASPSGIWKIWHLMRTEDRWRGDPGRLVAIAAATSRGKRLMRLAEKGIASICSGAASPVPMRQASERIRRCIQNRREFVALFGLHRPQGCTRGAGGGGECGELKSPIKNLLLVDMRIGTRDNVAHLKHYKLGLTLIPMFGIRVAQAFLVFRWLG